MSQELVPSKSTVYLSNLPFSLTNNDLHKIFEKFGRIVRVTIMKNKSTRESRGVAFILFLREKDAKTCVQSSHGTQLGGRTIRAQIAIDNGRNKEFVRKKVYANKTKCYECREEGHLSYECPSNSLGIRKPPVKERKKKKQKTTIEELDFESTSENGGDELYNSCLETLGAVIEAEQEKREIYELPEMTDFKRKRIRKSAYFSDEEEFSE